MKKLFVLLSFVLSVNLISSAVAFIDPKISGTIILPNNLKNKLTPNGVLYVFAKRAGPDSSPGSHMPPVAVIKIDHPKFPQAFEITGKNVMMEGTSLKGPLHIIARYSVTGNPLDKTGAIEGFDPKFPSTDVGNNKLNIELKTILK